jgi:hypothetical protein
LHPQICVGVGDFNLLPLEEEVKVKGLLQLVENYHLGFTQVDRQLSKVTEES